MDSLLVEEYSLWLAFPKLAFFFFSFFLSLNVADYNVSSSSHYQLLNCQLWLLILSALRTTRNNCVFHVNVVSTLQSTSMYFELPKSYLMMNVLSEDEWDKLLIPCNSPSIWWFFWKILKYCSALFLMKFWHLLF